MSRATQQARAARLAEADAAIDDVLSRLVADTPTPDNWQHWIGELARLALDEMDGWAQWHLGRADDRGEQAEALGFGKLSLEGGAEAMGGVIEAVGMIARAIAEGATADAMGGCIDALHRAISEAKHAAERDCLSAAGDLETIAEAQAEEIETSPLRGWARSLAAILHAWGEAQAEPAAGHRWLTAAALDLVFDGLARAGSAEA